MYASYIFPIIIIIKSVDKIKMMLLFLFPLLSLVGVVGASDIDNLYCGHDENCYESKCFNVSAILFQ